MTSMCSFFDLGMKRRGMRNEDAERDCTRVLEWHSFGEAKQKLEWVTLRKHTKVTKVCILHDLRILTLFLR
jgi:hypothetical protein